MKLLFVILLFMPWLAMASPTSGFSSVGSSSVKSAAPPMWTPYYADKQLSKQDVVRKVRKKYGAEVLKVKYNQASNSYRVRILLPNGKIKHVNVNASR